MKVEWIEDKISERERWYFNSPIGHFEAAAWTVGLIVAARNTNFIKINCDSIEAAKSACEADYMRRVNDLAEVKELRRVVARVIRGLNTNDPEQLSDWFTFDELIDELFGEVTNEQIHTSAA